MSSGTPSTFGSADKSLHHITSEARLSTTSRPSVTESSRHDSQTDSVHTAPERETHRDWSPMDLLYKKSKKSSKSKTNLDRDHRDSVTHHLFKELLTKFTPKALDMSIHRTESHASQMTNASVASHTSVQSHSSCFAEKYGHLEEVLGHGAQATVRLVTVLNFVFL
jgi:hypothetical protein